MSGKNLSHKLEHKIICKLSAESHPVSCAMSDITITWMLLSKQFDLVSMTLYFQHLNMIRDVKGYQMIWLAVYSSHKLCKAGDSAQTWRCVSLVKHQFEVQTFSYGVRERWRKGTLLLK